MYRPRGVALDYPEEVAGVQVGNLGHLAAFNLIGVLDDPIASMWRDVDRGELRVAGLNEFVGIAHILKNLRFGSAIEGESPEITLGGSRKNWPIHAGGAG
jgi:hypothetical protein